VASRRKAEELILQGRVTVNREVVARLGAKADPATDTIEVDGRALDLKGPFRYILLNKPKDCISAVSDPLKRPVVTDFIRNAGPRVFPVGRLDYDAEGVLLLTSDGELCNRLIHPRYSVPKTYLVKVRGVPGDKALERLARGVRLADGRTRPAEVSLARVTRDKKNSWLEITVFEGRNRLIKRMCKAVGHPVSKLKRIAFAGIRLGGLKRGESRALSAREIERLRGF